MSMSVLPRWFLLSAGLLLFAFPSAQGAPLEISSITPGFEDQRLCWRIVLRHSAEPPTTALPAIKAKATGAHIKQLVHSQFPGEGERGAPTHLFLEVVADDASDATPELEVWEENVAAPPVKRRLPRALDLAGLPWQALWLGQQSRLELLKSSPTNAPDWNSIRLPAQWNELGVTWLRVSFVVPAAWRGRSLSLRITAIDDRDATWLNGRRVGQTDGWDKPRDYALPPELVHWGRTNELAIAVDNGFAGGGIYRPGIWLCSGDDPVALPGDEKAVLLDEGQRAAPRPIGTRLPLRRLQVREGVLCYPDGTKPALWGVNYYPQSWTQYQNLKKHGVDHRRSIDDDFADFEQMGLDLIRIHVFDSEITDAGGNLVPNEHLELLDYLVRCCNERGIYLMLTPIAWWNSPGARPDAFSRNIPKEALSMWPGSWGIQTNYLRQFLGHTNIYTGRRLADEPCLCLLEIINEPQYWTFGAIMAGQPGDCGVPAARALTALDGVRQAWQQFLPSRAWETSQTFASFHSEVLRRYIDTMIAAMRAVGATQPIAYSFWQWQGSDPGVVLAIAESRCDAITLGAYPGGLPQDARNDKVNLLGSTRNFRLDSRLAAKARLVYEFDAAGTLHQVSMYPAIARQWRHLGVQAACQFQYDPRALAHLNCDWPQHYLNWSHTPAKAASFVIASEVFHRLPRGAAFDCPDDDQVFGPAAVSFQRNAALFCAPDLYIQARPTDWRPLPVPATPARILSVGSCPFFDYAGSGIVELRFQGQIGTLVVHPDLDRLRDDLLGTPDKPLTRLVSREHLFQPRLPEWPNPRLQRQDRSNWIDVPRQQGGFPVRPGTYRLTRSP